MRRSLGRGSAAAAAAALRHVRNPARAPVKAAIGGAICLPSSGASLASFSGPSAAVRTASEASSSACLGRARAASTALPPPLPFAPAPGSSWVRRLSTSAIGRKAAPAFDLEEETIQVGSDKKTRVLSAAAAVHSHSVTRHHPRQGSDKIRKPKKRIAGASEGAAGAEGEERMRFEDMKMDVRLKKALTEDFGYEEASPVQRMCFDPCMSGEDVVLRAKTGTGKTIGFLLPLIQQHFREGVKMARQKPRRVPILIITPTRELAKQAEQEASKLLKYLPRSLRAQSCIGGTARGMQMKRLERVPPFVLAATPGRLLDMIRTCGWEHVFDDLRALVLDEADRLLDMGFRREIEQILQHLNDRQQGRQTLLFSATFPPDVEQVARLACLRPTHMIEVPDTAKEETAATVRQRAAEVPMGDLLPALHSVIHGHIAERALQRKRAKVMVFFPTASQTQFFSKLFEGDKYNLYTLHSRMQQSKRDRVSGTFRSVQQGVLFTTDVSARGLDYPNVSLVVQVGLPPSREQYVHRVGRTGRGGSTGEAVMLTTPEEAAFVRAHLQDLPIAQQTLVQAVSSGSEESDDGAAGAEAAEAVDALLEESRGFLERRFASLRRYDPERGAETYMSFLGHYRSMIGPMQMKPQDLVTFANAYATEALMLPEAPVLSQALLARMGLDDKSLKGIRRGDRRRHAHSRMPDRRHRKPSRARKSRPPPRY